MTDDIQALRLASARRSIEKSGGNWNGTVTYAALMAAIDGVDQIIDAQAKRIATLEKQVTGLQTKGDHLEKHALIFRGAWQPASEYPPGAVVRHRGAAFTALRHIVPGKAEPGRTGSGWDLIV